MQFLQFDNKMQSPKVQSADGGDRHSRKPERKVGKELQSRKEIVLAKSVTGSSRVLDQFRPLTGAGTL